MKTNKLENGRTKRNNSNKYVRNTSDVRFENSLVQQHCFGITGLQVLSVRCQHLVIQCRAQLKKIELHVANIPEKAREDGRISKW